MEESKSHGIHIQWKALGKAVVETADEVIEKKERKARHQWMTGDPQYVGIKKEIQRDKWTEI